MRFLQFSALVAALVGISACNQSSSKVETADSAAYTANTDTAWTDVGGGVKLRKNADIQKQLEGRIFARNYEQEVGDGLKNNIEYSMGLCKQGQMTTHEKTTAMAKDGNKKESPVEVFDEGQWQAMEDQKGNLYIRINMKKAGVGFLNFEIKGKDLLLKNGENAEIFAEQAGGC